MKQSTLLKFQQFQSQTKHCSGGHSIQLSAHCSQQLAKYGWTIYNGQFITRVDDRTMSMLNSDGYSNYYETQMIMNANQSEECVVVHDIGTF